MKRFISQCCSFAIVTIGFQPAYACSTWKEGSKEARAQQRQIDALDRMLKRAKKKADTIVVGTFTEIASQVQDDGVPEESGTISVESVLRGVASNNMAVSFTPFDWADYCRPQFAPESGERAKYFIKHGHIVASEEARK